MNRLSHRLPYALAALVMICAAVAGSAESPDLTERPELWTCGAEDCAILATMYPTRSVVADGAIALALNHTSFHEHYVVYPKYRDANWDLSGCELIEVRLRPQSADAFRSGSNPRLYLRDRDGGFVRIRPEGRESLLPEPDEDGWMTVRIPVQPADGWETFRWMGGSLDRVDFLEIALFGGSKGEGIAHHVLVDGVRILPESPAYEPPDESLADLDVLWIGRTPRYERYDMSRYDPSPIDSNVMVGVCANTDRKHQPDPAEPVTFTAYLQNKGRKPLGGRYAWVLDGKDVDGGQIPVLDPREKIEFAWEWEWDPDGHDLAFRIDADGPEFCDRNNELRIRTDALMLKHLVERGAIAQMERRINMFGSRSAEDYLQGQIRFMNQLLTRSTYPFAPEGSAQTVMIGLIEFCDDGHLVTLGAGPYKVGELDLSVDGGRGVAALPDPWGSGGAMSEFLNYAGRPDGAWLHELSHQIGLIDDYQLITEPGDNLVNGVGFTWHNRGLMGGGDVGPRKNPDQLYSYYAASNIMGMNATRGKRRGYFGEYLYCLPREIVLRLVDEDGDPIANAPVALYQTNNRVIDKTPEHEGVTDENGLFLLENRPADHVTTLTGCTQRDNPFGPIHVVGFNGLFLVTAGDGETERYSFLPVLDLNVAWATGCEDRLVYRLELRPKGDEERAAGRTAAEVLDAIER